LVIEKLNIFAHKLTNKYIFMNHYETVFILNPVLSDVQVKETVSKFEDSYYKREPQW
jgi:small subunit ribosomal protein S6